MPIEEIVLGSRNLKKLKELQQRLTAEDLTVVDLSLFPDAPEIDEIGSTFHDNAQLKAVRLAQALQKFVLGEDSGLVVPALAGEPGVYSARYAGEHGNDQANIEKLLSEIKRKNLVLPQAYYVSSLVFADPNGTALIAVEATCQGFVLDTPRGDGGFGYDPIFFIPEYHATLAELPAIVKQAISHRARATERFVKQFQKLRKKNQESLERD